MAPGSAAPLGLALLGLLLGMRHATDPDHVIAVTAILSRERRIGVAMRIGLLWGLGHTLTVLVVGAAIIIFKLRIPVRAGLIMEFAGAVALILLALSAAKTSIQRVMAAFGWVPIAAATSLEVHSHPHSHGHGIHRHPHAHVHRDTANLHAIVAAPDYHEHALRP